MFAAGYIFAYNLPFLSRIGINLYQTLTLLIIALRRVSLPTNARVLVGAVSQLQPRSRSGPGARCRRAGRLVRAGCSRRCPGRRMAWLFTFCAVFLELPLSQLLYAPGSPPGVRRHRRQSRDLPLRRGHGPVGAGRGIALTAVGLVLGGYRLLAPAGWRRIGGAVRG